MRFLSAAGTAKADHEVSQTNLVSNLVSDGGVPAVINDKGFINPWGISEGPKTPFWVSVNGSGVSNLYSVPGPGNTPVGQVGLVVTIPAASGVPGDVSAPTGQVFNGTAGFKLGNGSPALFLFASEDGAISGWNGGTTAQIAPPAPAGAVYKGLALDGGRRQRLFICGQFQ